MNDQMLLLKGHEIESLLEGQEAAIIESVADAYRFHSQQQTIMPPNSYLRFPEKEKERIIAKAAYLGGAFQEAGLKWIASFPGNLSKGIERASATLILNSAETGHPTAILESSIISAKRTAASAALAAQKLNIDGEAKAVGLVGCGLINYETLRFLFHLYPQIEKVFLLDLSKERAEQFGQKVSGLNQEAEIVIAKDLQELLSNCKIIAFGTTAVKPFVSSLDGHLPNAIMLHTSLRDLTEEVILQADNVVDDIEQVCSNQTSLHLAEQQSGNRDFIRSTIGDILEGTAPAAAADQKLHIFSPFGLGILDLAVAHLVKKLAYEQRLGTFIDNFIPQPWQDRK